MAKNLKVRALTINQDGKTPLYSFFLKAEDIMRVADISRVHRGAEGELLGYQRGEVSRHVGEICEYLNSSDVLFPNAIIMALTSAVRFTLSRGPRSRDGDALSGWLEIPLVSEGNKVAWIVDGQQRTLALSRSKRKDMLVPVTSFVSDDYEVHRTQFLLVNKVQPLPIGLINELLPTVNTTLPPSLARNRIPSAICDILSKDPDSPFFGLIIRQTTDRRENKTAVVADNSLLQVVKASLNSVHGCLYPCRNAATGDVDVEQIRKILNLYWSAVRDVFPEAWAKPPLRSRLMHGVGIKAMGVLMDRVMNTIYSDAVDAPDKIRDILRSIRPHCAWTSGEWPLINGIAWNQLQNTPSHVKLLANMLVRQYLGLSKR